MKSSFNDALYIKVYGFQFAIQLIIMFNQF